MNKNNHLLESNIECLLSETTTACHEMVLADKSVSISTYSAVDQQLDQPIMYLTKNCVYIIPLD
jgi:hypothetical protein